MIKCKDCRAFSQQSEEGGICSFTSFGTVNFDDGCRAGSILNDIYNSGKREGRADMLKEIEEGMYTQCFERDNDEDMQKWDGGNWFRYKLFENVLEQLKEKSNE